MAKTFAPRVSKKKRKSIHFNSESIEKILERNDKRLFDGAKLNEIKLSEIEVKEQVRTKFNDSSIKKLAENIKVNGLIQPLVIHRVENKYHLLCGERRYRAMTLIGKETAPCFILENKSIEELMAIQFSENSSRENLHYIDKADGIFQYQEATEASERQIQKALNISKSEVHRSLVIAKIDYELKEAAKKYNIEKYVLLEFLKIEEKQTKDIVKLKILRGEIKRRAQLKSFLKEIIENSAIYS